MADLPPLETILSSSSEPVSPLATSLSILFEPSPILLTKLVPQLSANLTADSPITSYSELIDVALVEISQWDDDTRSRFIAGHPRIGESKNLSTLSAKEQGAAPSTGSSSVTPPEVLERLRHLNACYEKRYPGLIYVTFVNGRSRAAIAEEIEDVLGMEHSLSPDEPTISMIEPLEVEEVGWKEELDRAVRDVGLIAKSRLKTIGVE